MFLYHTFRITVFACFLMFMTLTRPYPTKLVLSGTSCSQHCLRGSC
ncbi:unnamed protein product [Nezara viridula]|uniref:Uncharacterized protein n=1 Tax=Nezara viridula TaxID=85310 RepID=A0A9P0HA97_NEZVI|nr:unnamed protein product [Nezara viridula]